MTPVNGDFDQMLRRALHAEMDSVEPAEDGLDRIRQRMRAPWLVRQTSLMLTECSDLVWLIGIRLEPRFTSVRAAVADRGGAWGAFVGLLSSLVSVLAGLFVPSRGRGPAHRSGTGRAREGSNLAWLRPALAVAGAVVIVVAGVYGLAQVRDNLVLELFPGSNTSASTGGGADSTGHQGPTMEGQSAPAAIEPTSTGRGSAKPSPKTTCTRAPSKQQAAPSPSASASPTPTVTPTVTPDPTPTDTTTPPAPADTAAATTAALTVNLSAGVQTVANAAPTTTRCATASPASKS
jgi:hypothetical protein